MMNLSTLDKLPNNSNITTIDVVNISKQVAAKFLPLANNRILKLSLEHEKISAKVIHPNKQESYVKSEDLPVDLRNIKNEKTLDGYLKNAHARISLMNNGDIKLYVEQKANGGMWSSQRATEKATVKEMSQEKVWDKNNGLMDKQKFVEKAIKECQENAEKKEAGGSNTEKELILL